MLCAIRFALHEQAVRKSAVRTQDKRTREKPSPAAGSLAAFHHAPRVQHRRIRTRGAVAATQLTKRQLRLVNLENRKET